MQAPEQLTTARLTLLRPRRDDAAAIFERYAGDPDVTRLVGWPRHRSVADSAAFVDWSDEVWSTAPAGPYLALAGSGELVGSTGLDVETPWRAATGFVLARSAWGQGFATELATAMVQLSATLGLDRLYALCHPDNRVGAGTGEGRLPPRRCAPPPRDLPEPGRRAPERRRVLVARARVSVVSAAGRQRTGGSARGA